MNNRLGIGNLGLEIGRQPEDGDGVEPAAQSPIVNPPSLIVMPTEAIWAIDEGHFRQMIGTAGNLTARYQAAISVQSSTLEGRGTPVMTVSNGVAVIDITGSLSKQASIFQFFFGGTATTAVRQALTEAAQSPAVDAIMLRIDSPGGEISGVADLADDIRAAAGQKPLTAYIEDLGCSAAYWLASQANRVVANQTAIVGSIGVYMVVADWSKLFEDAGVVVHVVHRGKFKGAGAPGSHVTEEHLADFQRTIDALGDLFVAAVGRGRGISQEQANSLADGRVHVGVHAKALGLIDAIESFDAAMADLREEANKKTSRPVTPGQSQRKESQMSDTVVTEAGQQAPPVAEANPTGPKPATLAELTEAFPEAAAEFQMNCLKSGCTLPQAQAAWSEQLKAKLAAADEKITELQAKKPGVEPLGSASGAASTAAADDPVSRWHEAVAEKMKIGMTKKRATRAVVHEDPELHTAYIEAVNVEAHSRRGRRRS